MAAKRWVTLCLSESALHLSEEDLRADLARWVPGRVWLPGAERGRISSAHPYALFAFVPEVHSAAAWAARRSRYVERVLRDPVLDRDLQRSMRRVGLVKIGQRVRVVEGEMAGVEGEVVQALTHSVQILITLRSGNRRVWVKKWEADLS